MALCPSEAHAIIDVYAASTTLEDGEKKVMVCQGMSKRLSIWRDGHIYLDIKSAIRLRVHAYFLHHFEEPSRMLVFPDRAQRDFGSDFGGIMPCGRGSRLPIYSTRVPRGPAMEPLVVMMKEMNAFFLAFFFSNVILGLNKRFIFTILISSADLFRGAESARHKIARLAQIAAIVVGRTDLRGAIIDAADQRR